jgi:2,4-dienoyl-CoA reductase (NADPH2)
LLDHVWQPGAIGPLQLPHRLVMGSMHLGLESVDPDGSMLAAFYAERAAGGAGLIVTGGSAVSRVGAGGVSYSFINEDAEVDKLAAIPQAVHAAGGLVLLQLFHAGRYAFEKSFGLQPVAPSAVYSKYSRCEPRALSEEEILATIDDFAFGARRACELGFDGVEIMGSEGYLLSQFMAPVTNLRADDWGGDADRRMRFPLAVAAAVREASGPECAVVYRLSGADLVPGGAPLEDVIALASRLASGPADALNVGIGWHESRVPSVQ